MKIPPRMTPGSQIKPSLFHIYFAVKLNERKYKLYINHLLF